MWYWEDAFPLLLALFTRHTNRSWSVLCLQSHRGLRPAGKFMGRQRYHRSSTKSRSLQRGRRGHLISNNSILKKCIKALLVKFCGFGISHFIFQRVTEKKLLVLLHRSLSYHLNEFGCHIITVRSGGFFGVCLDCNVWLKPGNVLVFFFFFSFFNILDYFQVYLWCGENVTGKQLCNWLQESSG